MVENANTSLGALLSFLNIAAAAPSAIVTDAKNSQLPRKKSVVNDCRKKQTNKKTQLV